MRSILTLSSVPDFIDVDGVSRPTSNSNGLPISRSLPNLINFWQWFGDSKAVDAIGRPKVFYHGTSHDIAVFRESSRGNLGAGIYLTDSRTEAESYTHDNYHYPMHVPGGNIIPVYVRTLKPYVWTDEDSDAVDSVAQQIKVARSRGCDSVLHNKRRSRQHCVAFTSRQLKSAIGNMGRFNPDSESINM